MTFGIEQSARRVGRRLWRWSVSLTGETELDAIRNVTYRLHPSFAQPVRQVADRRSRFRLDERGLSDFDLVAQLCRTDDGVEELRHRVHLAVALAQAPLPDPAARLARAKRILLCYRVADTALAEALSDALPAVGLRAILPQDMPAGAPMQAWEEQAVRRASGLVVIYSQRLDTFMERSLALALQLRKPITLVALREAGHASPLPDVLAGLRAIEVRRDEADSTLEVVAQRLAGKIAATHRDRAELMPDAPGRSLDDVLAAAIDEAAGANPAAGELLGLLAVLAPDPIPRRLLEVEPAALPDNLRTSVARAEAIAVLARAALLHADEEVLSVHSAVQSAMQARLDEVTARLQAEAAIRLVSAALPPWPWHREHWAELETLMPHVFAASDEAERLQVAPTAAGMARVSLGMYLAERANFVEAEQLYRGAIAVFEATEPPDHAGLGLALSVLANLYRSMGEEVLAEPAYRRAIELGRTILGPSHPEVAKRIGNFAILCRDARPPRRAQARRLFEEAAGILREMHERLNQEVSTSSQEARLFTTTNLAGVLGNLGRLHFDQGEYSKAEPLYFESLKLDRTVLGATHPSLATRLNNLGELYRWTGQREKAKPFYEEAIQVVEASLGPNSPNLISPVHNLAELCRETNSPADAERNYRRAIALLNLINPPHPHLRVVLQDFSQFLNEQGLEDEARTMRIAADQFGGRSGLELA